MAKIIAGTSIPALAERLSEVLGLLCLKRNIRRFSDGELRIELLKSVYGETVIIVQSTCSAHDYLIELCLLTDAAKRGGATHIIAVIPYFGYSRQDRLAYEGGPISARLMATLLEASGVEKFITLDLHSKQSEGFFSKALYNIDPLPLWMNHISSGDWVVIAPDIGGVVRAQKLAEKLGCDIAAIHKKRHSPGSSHLNNCIIGHVTGKNCLIIDDIVDTGLTLSYATFLLNQAGATYIQAFITHGVLSGEALFILENTPIDKIIISDSIAQGNLPPYFEIIECVPALAQAVRRFLH